MEKKDTNSLVPAAQAAPQLGIGVSTLYEMARKKRVPHYRFCDRVLFDVDEIRATARVQAEGGKGE